VLIFFGPNTKQVELSSLTFINPNLWTRTRAVWSELVRYYDPKLGSCFAQGSPLFIWQTYNNVVTPYLFAALGLVLVALLLIKIFSFNVRAARLVIALFFGLACLSWAVLEIRNEVFYLKGIGRAVGLYWGKIIRRNARSSSGTRNSSILWLFATPISLRAPRYLIWFLKSRPEPRAYI
jgi:hypothetical protein